LAALLPAVTKPALTRRPIASAQLTLDWQLIAGAHLAAQTQPRRLTGGTLTIACAGPVALELQHLADVLIGRINRHMGHDLVQRLRLVQEPLSFTTPPAPRARPLTEQDRTAVERRLADLPSGPVRQALADLALAMRSR
jgi:hypothetical protein